MMNTVIKWYTGIKDVRFVIGASKLRIIAIKNNRKTQRQDIVERVRGWLKPEGIELFRDYYREHGRVDPVIFNGAVPHPVHFREGMAVRNQIRKMFPGDFTDHELDGMWVEIVREAIEEE